MHRGKTSPPYGQLKIRKGNRKTRGNVRYSLEYTILFCVFVGLGLGRLQFTGTNGNAHFAHVTWAWHHMTVTCPHVTGGGAHASQWRLF